MSCWIAFGVGYFIGAAVAFAFLLFALDRGDRR